jgi:predicted nucleotidyltransferase
MKENSYECVYKSENVAQYISPLKLFGEVDFLLAFRYISIKMLKRATQIDIFGGEFKIKVLRPEDIIGLKLQALINDTTRVSKEYADIEALMDYHKRNLDWALIEEYFAVFDKTDEFRKLKNRFYNA